MKAEDRYDSLIVWYARQYGRDARAVKRQLRTESWFNPRARNKKTGAMGLAQFMPATWREWQDCTPGIQAIPEGEQRDSCNPEDAIAALCSYMQWLTHYFKGYFSCALAGYVWGPGNVEKCMDQHGEGWLAKAPKDVRDYVKNCTAFVGERLVVLEEEWDA